MTLRDCIEKVNKVGPLVRVLIIEAKGSTPREIGAAMIVNHEEFDGTIGGGALEYDALRHARLMLTHEEGQPWLREVKNYPLGPSLGQCCGGFIKLLFERYTDFESNYIETRMGADIVFCQHPLLSGGPLEFTNEHSRTTTKREVFLERINENRLQLYLYGAGHVGREVVRIFSGLDVDIVWIDIDRTRFPEALPGNVKRLVIDSPAAAVSYAPDNAFHLVMTYSHPLDLEICHAVFKRGSFEYLGLIVSNTKRIRFEKQLEKLGIQTEDFKRMICPVGLPGLRSKKPSVIAVSIAAQIMKLSGQQCGE